MSIPGRGAPSPTCCRVRSCRCKSTSHPRRAGFTLPVSMHRRFGAGCKVRSNQGGGRRMKLTLPEEAFKRFGLARHLTQVMARQPLANLARILLVLALLAGSAESSAGKPPAPLDASRLEQFEKDVD